MISSKGNTLRVLSHVQTGSITQKNKGSENDVTGNTQIGKCFWWNVVKEVAMAAREEKWDKASKSRLWLECFPQKEAVSWHQLGPKPTATNRHSAPWPLLMYMSYNTVIPKCWNSKTALRLKRGYQQSRSDNKEGWQCRKRKTSHLKVAT